MSTIKSGKPHRSPINPRPRVNLHQSGIKFWKRLWHLFYWVRFFGFWRWGRFQRHGRMRSSQLPKEGKVNWSVQSTDQLVYKTWTTNYLFYYLLKKIILEISILISQDLPSFADKIHVNILLTWAYVSAAWIRVTLRLQTKFPVESLYLLLYLN